MEVVELKAVLFTQFSEQIYAIDLILWFCPRQDFEERFDNRQMAAFQER